MGKALIVAALSGFITAFLQNDINILGEMGYEVHCAANDNVAGTRMDSKVLQNLNITFHDIPFNSKAPLCISNIKALKNLNKLLKCQRFDIVHCHTPIVGLITRIVCSKYRFWRGMTVIYTTHGFTFCRNTSRKSWLIYHTIENFASFLSDAIITINKEDYQQALRMHCKKVYQIPGVGVDIKKYRNVDLDRNVYRESIGVDPDDVMISSVGELSARKNHQVVIRAISLIPAEERKKFVYVLCGHEVENSGMAAKLKDLGEKLNVRVVLLGMRRDIPEIDHCSDIAMLPSVREGLGLAGVEALAAGIPVIGSRVQGIADYVIDGVTGYLCEYNSPQQFRDAILKIVSLSTEDKIIMRNNCMLMSERFDISVSKNAMKDIYGEFCNI